MRCATAGGVRAVQAADLQQPAAPGPLPQPHPDPARPDEQREAEAEHGGRPLQVEMDDPQEVARQIVHAIAAELEELYLGWPEKLFVRLNGLLPRLVDQALRKQLPVIKRFACAEQPQPPTPQPNSTGEHP